MSISNIIEKKSIKQEIILKIFPLSILFFSVYTFISFFVIRDYIGGYILLACFLFCIVSIVVYFKTKNLKLIGNMLASLGIPVLLPWLITGGPFGSSFWWSLVYVVWAFLVTDKKSAIFWLCLYLFLCFIIAILYKNGYIKMAYSFFDLLNLLFAYVFIFILIYFFDSVSEYYLKLSSNREEELTQLNNDLTATNAELEQFAYVASHDLQEPLRTISNYVGLVDEKLGDKKDSNITQYFAYVLSATSRMQMLVKDLMEYSRVGKNPVFEEEESNAKIVFKNLPVITAVDIEIKRLFQNLIDNSIKFRRKDVPPEITIDVEEKPDEYLFSIKDNGIGINEKYIPKLFIIFQRLHSAEEYPGTGIGLVTAKKIVTLHNGKIWVDGKENEGCTFYFTIPRKNFNRI